MVSRVEGEVKEVRLLLEAAEKDSSGAKSGASR
jgi:hypothetical protein